MWAILRSVVARGGRSFLPGRNFSSPSGSNIAESTQGRGRSVVTSWLKTLMEETARKLGLPFCALSGFGAYMVWELINKSEYQQVVRRSKEEAESQSEGEAE